MNSPGVPPEGPPQNATGAESQSIPKKAKRTVELVRARHETLIRRVLVGWGQGTSTHNGRPTLIAKQQLILRDLVIEMAVELGQAEGRELLARSRAPEQFESDLSSLLKSTANNSLARWRSITEWYDLRAQGTKKAGSQEVEIQKCVLYRLIPFAESLKLKAWSTHRTRLEAEGRTEVRKIADLVEGSACTHAVRTTAAPNQRIGDLSDEKGMAGPANSESPDGVAFEGLAVGTPGRGNEDSEERGERRRAFVMPKLASTGWSRSRWAADAGVGKNCVYEYLRGVRQPTSENRRALAEALAVRLEDLPE
jgi:hypothetical protein